MDASALEGERGRVLLEAVLRQLPDGVLVVDRTLATVLANERAEALLGDALAGGASLLETLAARSAKVDGSAIDVHEHPLARAVFEGVTVARDLLRYTAPGASPATLQVAATPVHGADGELLAAVAILSDATERERVNRAMRDFVTNAAHELQTPIAAIVSAAEVLQAGAKSRARDRDRFLHHIEEQAGRLARLVRTLLVLARAQSALEPARVETVPLLELLEDVRARIHPPAGVSVEVTCPADLGVVANRDLVEQALMNLAANAARHTSRGRVSLRAHADGEQRVAIEVTDTGKGIPESDLERIFDRFYRGEGSPDGSGLGLAIVRDVVDTLGGELSVDSRVGAGTTVRLRLPGVRYAAA